MSRDIDVVLIDPDPEQPRKYFDPVALTELAQSMAETGLAVPILVRPTGDRFLLVHGERRWRAAKELGWETVPAVVRDLDRETGQWFSLIENVQRSDLTPIEEAAAFKRHLDAGMSQVQLAKRIGKSQSYIAHKLRLLTLPPPLLSYVEVGALSEGHMRELLRIRKIYGAGDAGRDIERDLPLDVPGDRFFDYLDPEGVVTPNGQWVPDLTDRATVFGLFVVLRPLEHPGGWIGAEESRDISPALTRGCHAFLRWLAKQERVPAWVVAAFWFASAAVQDDLSVATLSRLIDHFRDFLYGAVMFTHLWRIKPPTWSAGQMEWWGYRGDLRHAGLDRDALPRDLLARVSEWLDAGNDPPLPSMIQSWGFGHEEYQEALAGTGGLPA